MLWRSFLILICALSISCGILFSKKNHEIALKIKEAKQEIGIYRNEKASGEIVIRKISEERTSSSYYLEMKSLLPSGIEKNDYIPGEFIKQKAGSKKLAILLSGMGETSSTITIADSLARAKYDVLRLYPKIRLFDLKKLNTKDRWNKKEFTSFVWSGRNTLMTRYGDIEYLVTFFKNKYKYESIGIMGVSLGGITAYYLSGRNPEMYQSTIGIITGGKLCEILLVSAEREIIEIRQFIFDKFLITEQEAHEILCSELNDIDPLSVSGNINTENALLVSNILDTVIPHRFTYKLWQTAHKPKWKIMIIKLPVFWAVNGSFWLDGHYSSGLSQFIPVPFFEFWGPVPLPTYPETAASLVLDHFNRTLK